MTTINELMVEAQELSTKQPVYLYYQCEEDFEDTLGDESPLFL